MFVPEAYKNYKYIVSLHDNYVVLSSRSSVSASFDSPTHVTLLYQYFTPSTYSILVDQTYYNNTSFILTDISSNFYERADCPTIICATFCIGLFLIFIINGLTKLVKRGGIFFGE